MSSTESLKRVNRRASSRSIGGIVTVWLALSAAGLGVSRQDGTAPSYPPVGKIILVMIEFSDMHCPLCMEYLTNFNQNLNPSQTDGRTVGIVRMEKSRRTAPGRRDIRIAERQIRGFAAGHGLRFPLLLDRHSALSGLFAGDHDIILIDPERNLIKRYRFPLTGRQLEEILSFHSRSETDAPL